MYYLGALTRKNASTDSVQLCIPNEQSRNEYISALRHQFSIQGCGLTDLRSAVTQMIGGDIGPLCQFVQTHFLDLQQHNDVIHSMEHTLKSVFILALSVARGPDTVFSEYEIPTTQVDTVLLSRDDASPIIHIEFKNSTVGHIKGQYNTRNWPKMNDYSETIFSMAREELLKLPLADNCRSYDKLLQRKPQTTGDMWQVVCLQAQNNRALLCQEHASREVISYVVYRIGLRRVLWERLER